MMAVTAQMRVLVRRSGGLPQGHRRTGEGVSGGCCRRIRSQERCSCFETDEAPPSRSWRMTDRASGCARSGSRRAVSGTGLAKAAPCIGSCWRTSSRCCSRAEDAGGDLRRAVWRPIGGGGVGSGVGPGEGRTFRACVLSVAMLFVGHERRVDAQGPGDHRGRHRCHPRADVRAGHVDASVVVAHPVRAPRDGCRRTVRHGTRRVRRCSLRFIAQGTSSFRRRGGRAASPGADCVLGESRSRPITIEGTLRGWSVELRHVARTADEAGGERPARGAPLPRVHDAGR